MNFRPLTEEYTNVVSIPANVASLPGSSKTIERLLTKRQNEHKSTLDFLRLECRKINLQIEDEIRSEGNSLKESLGKIKTQIEAETSVVFKDMEEEKLANLSFGTFETLMQTIQDLNNRRLRIIDQFYDKLQALEKKRLTFFKGVFNEAYRKTGKICHLLPYDLAYYFDQEISKINEISMSNYGHYAQMHTDLKLQIQEEIPVFLINSHDAKERHKMAVTNMKWKEVMPPRERNNIIESTKLPFLALGDPSYAQVSLPLSATDLEMWEQRIQKTLESLDVTAKKLISLYKIAVLQIFNRFFDDLKLITNALTEEDNQLNNRLTLESITSGPYKSILLDVAELYTCDIAELQNLWTNITTYMETNINNTNTFLKNSAHLWDNHFARTDEIKELVLKDLTNLIEKHNKLAQTFEKKMNNSLDKLREGSSVAKLNKHLRDVNKFLDLTGNLYSSQCEAEIKLITKYYELTEQETELLISELDRFLGENADKEPIHERRSWQNINVAQEQQPSPNNSEDNLIPYQMKCCQYQVDAVNNWMFGLWEALKAYMVTCRSEQLKQAEQWMDHVKSKLRKRLEIRESTLRPRYIRVKTMIYDVRLKELEDHQNSIQKLENKVQKYVTDSRQATQLSKEKRVEIVEEFESAMRGIEEKLQNSTKSFHVAACIEQTKTLSEEAKTKFEETFKDNYNEIEQNRKNIIAMICHFGTKIKLFSEGGNFNRDEAKIYKKRFLKMQKGVPKKFKKVYAEFEASKPEIVNMFRRIEIAVLDRLNKSLKEFEHNEKTCEKIKQLRENIRKLAYDTKFKIHRIDANIDYFSDMSKIEIWKRKHFDIMKDALQECIEKIVEIDNFMIGDSENIERSYIFQLNELIDSSFEEIATTAKASSGIICTLRKNANYSTDLSDRYLGSHSYHCKAPYEKCCLKGCCSVFDDIPWFVWLAIALVLLLFVVLVVNYCCLKPFKQTRRTIRDPPLQEEPLCQRTTEIVVVLPNVEPERSNRLPTYKEAIELN
ncbi:uncharacterized protein LOC123010272 isoform X2 [Tribolium madens]|uniref:uncharacterized protein LOC123010272 isoform X2 n=1 Tax=Tribolium madens TaxID=41895 RepID=UPI001CF7602D|nr:uncharacterized protein LOC123010272 isoform X2 [Tribolium madens]